MGTGTCKPAVKEMRCICCLSDRFKPGPIGLDGYCRCLRCGLLFNIQRESLRDKVIKHYEKVDPHFEVAVSKQAFFKSALKHISTHFENRKGILLDVGCGFGYFLELAEKDMWETQGIEIMSYTAREKEQKNLRSNIYKGSLKDAKYPDNYFDVATLWDVLVVVEKPSDELEECYRVLRQGGIIGIRVRNVFFQRVIYWIYFPLRRIAQSIGIKPPYVFHPFCFSAKSIRLLLQRTGFTSIKISPSPLTKGDPYQYTSVTGIARMVKAIVGAVSNVIFWISCGRLLTGPSLLVWAEKPNPESTV